MLTTGRGNDYAHMCVLTEGVLRKGDVGELVGHWSICGGMEGNRKNAAIATCTSDCVCASIY